MYFYPLLLSKLPLVKLATSKNQGRAIFQILNNIRQ